MPPDVFVASFYIPTLADKVQEALPHVNVIKLVPTDKLTLRDDCVSRMRDEAEIVFCDTLLTKYCLRGFKRLKWIQAKGAGVNAIMRHVDPSQPPDFVVTRITANSRLIGEYVMMMVLALERNLLHLFNCQKTKQWKQYDLACHRSLTELSVLVLGIGAMGKEIARRCKQLGMKVYGVTRSQPAPSSRCEHVDEYVNSDRLTSALESCDYVCCALPSTPETKGLLSGDVLSSCQHKTPVLINVGRGDVIDEGTLSRALDSKWIGGAVLDVFTEEPLPDTSPLWEHPNVIVTPHIAGYSRNEQIVDDYVEEFKQNYLKYCNSEPLNNVVDFTKGY